MADEPTIGTVAMPESFVLTEEFCASVKDVANDGFTKDRLDRLWTAIHAAALSTRPAQEPVAYTTLAELAQVRSGYYGRMQDDANDFGWSVPLYAAPQPVLSQPEVKALEWDRAEGGPGCDVEAIPDPYHRYHVRHLSEGRFDVILNTDLGSLWFGQHCNQYHPTYDAAKAAAQSDYEQRIRSALCPLSDIPAQAGEVVTPNRKAALFTLSEWLPAFRPDELDILLDEVEQALATASEGSADE